MDYKPFSDYPDATSLFKTSRGSTYAHFPDNSTIRNRDPSNHTDKTSGMQARSLKTVFVDTPAVNALSGWTQDAGVGTRLVPEIKDGKPTGHLLVQISETRGSPLDTAKVGDNVSRVPYNKNPSVGSHPVEVYNSESKKGTKGTGIHFGNLITEVNEPKKMLNIGNVGKIAGALGVLSAPTLGKAAEVAFDVVSPWWAGASTLSSGTLDSPEAQKLLKRKK